MTSFDLCVIGGGPGGLSAAIRATQLGIQVCLVDPGPLGGTCLNRGCIPARAMGTTARLIAQLRNAQTLGVRLEGRFEVDLEGVILRKERILRRMRAGLENLIRQQKVTWFQGRGTLQGRNEVQVRLEGNRLEGIQAKSIILATGSRPGSLPGCPVDGRVVITSDEILDLRLLPSALIVVGAGVVGCEFASYFSDLGIPVTLIEAAARVLPSEEERISEAFRQSLQKRGVTVLTGTKVQGITPAASSEATVTLTDGRTFQSPLVLMAAGRAAQLPDGAQELGLKLEEGGLMVDETLRTKVPSILAIGDLLGGYQLACTASYEGAVAAENAVGGFRRTDYRVVPDAIYTEPEIASVGLTEQEAIQAGRSVTVTRLSFTGFARAQTFEEMEGFVQVVSDRKERKLLGVQMIGPRATDLIGEAALAIKHELTLQDLVETLHGHPTMSESLWETAAMALGQSIYYATASR